MFRWNFPTPAKQPSMKVQEVSSILGTHQKSWSRNDQNFHETKILEALGINEAMPLNEQVGKIRDFRDVVGWSEGKGRYGGWGGTTGGGRH